jgi:methylmalonyl-CoA mutase N-terminal domain/subunit
MGGMLAAIETGWIQSRIQEEAYLYQRGIESRERIVVGVNEYRMAESERVPVLRVDPAIEASQVEFLNRVRRERDSRKVNEALDALLQVSQTNENLMPHILNAVESYATVGEISDVFRKVHGEYREALAL